MSVLVDRMERQGWVRRVPDPGLALIVLFSALSGSSSSVGELVGFRAGRVLAG